MADIFNEVDQALRVERVRETWAQYKPLIIGVVAVLILGTAAQSGYVAWTKNRHEQATSALLSALRQNEPGKALDTLAQADETDSKTLGALYAAGFHLDKGQKAEALKLLNSVADDKDARKLFRDLAAINAATIAIDADPSVKAADLLAKVEPIAKDEKNTWRLQALWTVAMIKAYRGNDKAGAVKDLETLIEDKAAPVPMQQRARALADILSAQQSQKD